MASGQQGCDCQNTTVGEFFLSRGIDQIDSRQLAAGERLHNICTASAAQQVEERDAKWVTTVKVIEEKWNHMHETISNVSSTYEKESKVTLRQMQDFKEEVLENIARSERISNEERCIMGDEMRRMNAQLMEVKDAEIRGLLTRVETLQGRLTVAEEQKRESEDTLRTQAEEIASLRGLLAAAEQAKEEAGETLVQERTRNASIITQLKQECFILNDAIKEASVGVETQKQEQVTAVHSLNESLASVALESERYKQEIERLLLQTDEADQLVISKTQEVNIMKVTHESAIMDAKGQLEELTARHATCQTGYRELQEKFEAMSKQNTTVAAKQQALQAALEETEQRMGTQVAEKEAALGKLSQEHTVALATSKERDNLLQKVEAALAKEQDANKVLVQQHSEGGVERQRREASLLAQTEVQAKELELLQQQYKDARSALEAVTEKCEEAKRCQAVAEEQLAKHSSDDNSRVGTLEQQLRSNEAAAAELRRELAVHVKLVEKAQHEAGGAATEQQVVEQKLVELQAYTDEVTLSVTTYQEQTGVFESLNTELAEELKGLRMEAREVREERDALKEIVTMGRYDAMDSVMRDHPCVTEDEAKAMQREIKDGKIAGDILSRAIEYMYTNCIKAQEVLEGYLACLPAVPGFDNIDYFKLEEVHGQYTALLRDTVRVHVEARKRELEEPPAANPLSSVPREEKVEPVKPPVSVSIPVPVAVPLVPVSDPAPEPQPQQSVPEPTGTLSLLGATAIEPSASSFITTTNMSAMTVPPPEKVKTQAPKVSPKWAPPQAHAPKRIPVHIPIHAPAPRPKIARKVIKNRSPPPPRQNPQNLVHFGGKYSVPEVSSSPRMR